MRENKLNDETIILSLLSNRTIKEAAKSCGVSESSIYARLRDPAFVKKYDKAKKTLFKQGSEALQKLLLEAIETMGEICKNRSISPQIRLNAADAIIRNSVQVTKQAEILRRVEELEAKHGAVNCSDDVVKIFTEILRDGKNHSISDRLEAGNRILKYWDSHGSEPDKIKASNQFRVTLAEMLKNPPQNRNIADFEEQDGELS